MQRVGNRYSNITSEIRFVKRFWENRDLCPLVYGTYVPATNVPYDPDLVVALSRADTALSELTGLGRLLPYPHLLITPYMRREAVLSSRIEGTTADLSDLWLDEVEPGIQDRDVADIQEVRNYITALGYGG